MRRHDEANRGEDDNDLPFHTLVAASLQRRGKILSEIRRARRRAGTTTGRAARRGSLRSFRVRQFTIISRSLVRDGVLQPTGAEFGAIGNGDSDGGDEAEDTSLVA